jgi:Arc/MetJ-type ribon-helix-helix transcriptional regulator
MSGQREREIVEVPGEVLSEVDQHVERTEFANRSEYVTHILEEVLYQIGEDDESGQDDETTVNERQVEERLKSLGYLNE